MKTDDRSGALQADVSTVVQKHIVRHQRRGQPLTTQEICRALLPCVATTVALSRMDDKETSAFLVTFFNNVLRVTKTLKNTLSADEHGARN